MKVLIFGPSGAGKSYLSIELKKLGLNSVDADLIGPLSSWFYGDEKVQYQENADRDWLDNHSFLWDKDYLKQYLTDNFDIYLLGASGNVFEMFDLFDKVYYLNVSDKVQDERLQRDSRENPMGNTEYQRRNAIDWGHDLRAKAKDLEIDFIDATKTPEEIYSQLNASK